MFKTQNSYSLTNFTSDIFSYIRPYRLKFITGSFLRLTSDIANLYPAWALSQLTIILTHPTNNQIHQLTLIILGWIIAVTYYSLAHSLAKFFGYQVSERIALDTRLRAIKHIFSLDIAWQEKESTGNKLKRIDSGSTALDTVIRIYYDVIIEAILNSVGMFFIFTAIGLELGISMLVFMITYFAISSYLTKTASNQAYIVSNQQEILEGLSFESLNNIKTVKALAIHQGLTAKLKNQIDTTYTAIKKRILLFRIRSSILQLYYSLFRVGMIAYLVYAIINGRYDLGLLILFVGYIGKVEEAISELAEVTHTIVISKVQHHRLIDILHTQPTIETSTKKLAFPKNWTNIKFENVSFSYEKKSVLKDFNLTINRGQKIGIVGLSGAGKSTLFNLLLDLYENYQGQILIDTTPLTDIDRQDYIDHLSVVLQDTELFNLSLSDNIAIGGQPDKKPNSHQLTDAINTSYLSEVVARLPQGIDTVIGEKGVKLSGGEKQRLGIARALYRQPDLLLMDEATSHLDIDSEKKIQASLGKFFDQVTAVVIAHRLSTIKQMDRIIVMQGGKIIEQGSFDTLISKQGIFANLWNKQKL